VLVGEAEVVPDMLVSALAALPAESLLDGPPADGELLLHRILRQVRAERTARARVTVAVRPTTRWVKITATVTGTPAGEQCRLVITARNGSRRIAAAWTAADEVTTVTCVALMPPGDVTAIEVTDAAGNPLR
jgi:hypothetical protein